MKNPYLPNGDAKTRIYKYLSHKLFYFGTFARTAGSEARTSALCSPHVVESLACSSTAELCSCAFLSLLIILIRFFLCASGRGWSDRCRGPRVDQVGHRRPDAEVAAVGAEAAEHRHRDHRQGRLSVQVAEPHQRHGSFILAVFPTYLASSLQLSSLISVAHWASFEWQLK